MKRLPLLLILVCFPVVSFAYEARVLKTFGEVTIYPYSKAPTAPAEGMELFEKDSIKTGDNGWVALALPDNSKINIGNKTQITIYREKNKLEIQLSKGKLRADVKKFKDREVTFKTNTAVAGIRGTEFMLFNENNANVLFGKEGKIEVKGTKEGKQEIGRGEMTETTKGLKPILPQKIEPGSPLEDAANILSKITGDTPPDDFKKAEAFTDIIARWNVNFSRFLVDKKDFDEALHVLQIALDLGKDRGLRSDARLQKGNIYSVFLASYEEALAEHLLNLEEYPDLPQAEISLYQTAILLGELGFKDRALERFNEYKAKYPQGRYLNNIEHFLGN